MHQSVILNDLRHFQLPIVPSNAVLLGAASAGFTTRRALRYFGCLPCTYTAEIRRHIVVGAGAEAQGVSAAPWDHRKLADDT